MFDPGIGRWLSQDPIGFSAGDANLYRYVGNTPITRTDPSGLVYGWNHHCYPYYLGGSPNQIVADLSAISQADGVARHNAAHRFLAQQGFGPNATGQAAWRALSRRQQQAMIIRSMRAAGIANSWIRANISNIMSGAVPGFPTVRPHTFPGGVARVPLLSVFGGAVLTILTHPGVAHAAELDRTWRGLPADRSGRVEITEVTQYQDLPRFYNLFNVNLSVRRPLFHSETNPEWMQLGTMTVREARELEGAVEVVENPPMSIFTRPPPIGYYRIRVTYIIARFVEE